MDTPKHESINQDNRHLLQQLIDKILERHVHLQDEFEIAAILESMGWNDERVSEQFGSEDVFSLAKDIWEIIDKKTLLTAFTPAERPPVFRNILYFIKNFTRGLIFALPMCISVISMLTLRFSLWSYLNLSLELATSIAIGTILSFVTVGGFMQAIARRGFFYITQDNYNIARRMTFYFIKLGFILCILIIVILLLLNLFFAVFSMYMINIIVLYYLFLTAIWLSVTVMYILRKELAFTGLLVLGIGFVFIFFRIVKLDIIISQIISLSIVSVLSILVAIYYFVSSEKQSEKGISPLMPRKSITLYSVLPYFIYGFMYFAFLFLDRVIAWSANDSTFMPYVFWFRGAYELGLDFALLMLFIPMGINEALVSNLMLDIEISQKIYSLHEISTFNNRFLYKYIKYLVVISIVSVICAVTLYFSVEYLTRTLQLFGDFLSDDTIRFVFIWAILAYAIIDVSLMNAIILFSLSQPEMINRALLPSLTVNLVIGFLLSRWFDYHYAVLGLFSGAVVFVILSSIKAVRVFKKLDYYIYAGS